MHSLYFPPLRSTLATGGGSEDDNSSLNKISKISRSINKNISERNDKGKVMAFQPIKKNELPQVRGGAGKMAVTVRNNGQVSLSSLASKVIGTAEYVAFLFDADNRKALISANAKYIKLVNGKEGCFPISRSKNTKQCFFAAAIALKDPKFGIEYNYKESGSQSFDAEANEKEGSLTFTLPKGALKAKPVVPRKKKAAAAAAGATPDKATEEDEEAELEEAE